MTTSIKQLEKAIRRYEQKIRIAREKRDAYNKLVEKRIQNDLKKIGHIENMIAGRD